MSTDELKKAAMEALTKWEGRVESSMQLKDYWVDAFLAGAAYAQRWIPVGERLPELDTLVLACNPASIKPTYGWRTGGQ